MVLDQTTLDNVKAIGEELEAKPAVLIVGDTYSCKDTLKQLGGIWSREQQGWFVPLENLTNGKINEKPEPQPPKKESLDTKQENEGVELTKAQRRKGMRIWNIKLESLVLPETGTGGWQVGEVMLESELIAKTSQQVKIRATKLVGEEHPKLEFSLSCAGKWVSDKNNEKFQRSFGITGKYRITVW